ncbi:hypothetical protein [Oribacterium sp. FC2011]|uniref:hypothetical protein n=1 Tax=Oribacterium sp. FC2011 TaxID=1408311 RepID=UPI0004E20C68|nr:hypothetical protein [Oribacterium sp. FC2011]
MGVIREIINKDVALSEADNFPYAIIYTNSGIRFGLTPDVWENNKCSFNEARFFKPDEELHLFNYGDEMRAVRTKENNADYIEKKYALKDVFGNGTITVREYLDTDDDGQTFISATCLSDVEGLN